MIKFTEKPKSSLSQQTFAVLFANLFRHQLLRCISFYFRTLYAPSDNLRGRAHFIATALVMPLRSYRRWLVVAVYLCKYIYPYIHFYTAVIRPVLEYAAPVWHYAITQAQTQQLESVQKRTIHIIWYSTRGLSYHNALFAVNLPSLPARR